MRASPSFASAASTLAGVVKYHNMFLAPRPGSPRHDKKVFCFFSSEKKNLLS